MSLRDQTNAIKLVQGSTAFLPSFPLTDHSTGAPIDLTDVITATMNFRQQGTTGAVVSVPLTIGSPASGGIVSVTSWPAGSLDTAGMFEGEVVLHFSSTKLTLFPTVNFNIRASFA